MNIGDCKPMLIIETSHYFFINNVFKLYSSAANFIFFPRTAWTSVGARIQIVQVKMRIPYYKFYGTM